MFGDLLQASNSPFRTSQDFLDFIHKRRDQHPYYVDPLPGQIDRVDYANVGGLLRNGQTNLRDR